jgi:hypothetical protein
MPQFFGCTFRSDEVIIISEGARFASRCLRFDPSQDLERPRLSFVAAVLRRSSMELSKVPIKQLIEIYLTAKREIRRRKRARVPGHVKAREVVKTYEQMYSDIIGKDFAQNLRLAIPREFMDCKVQMRLKYLNPLLKQDWSHLFEHGNAERKFYVYAHVDQSGRKMLLPNSLIPEMRVPFYIGKGTGARAYDLSRNQGHGLKLRDLLSKGAKHSDIVVMIKSGLTEAEALGLEAKLIYFFRTIYEHRNGTLLNLELCQRPAFSGEMPINKKAYHQLRIHLGKIPLQPITQHVADHG